MARALSLAAIAALGAGATFAAGAGVVAEDSADYRWTRMIAPRASAGPNNGSRVGSR
jgi:hypothetical protein